MKRAALALFILGIAFGSSLVEGAFKYIQQGMSAPDAELVSLEGRSVSFGELVGEQGTIVLFWALWSPRSLQQLNDLASSYDSLKAAGVEVVAVSVDKQRFESGLIAQIRDYVEKQSIPFPVYIDQGLLLFYAYGIIATPSSAVIDPQNRVVYTLSGYSPFGADTMMRTALTVLGLRESGRDTLPEIRYPDPHAVRIFGMGLKIYRSNQKSALPFFSQAIAADSQFAAAHYYFALAAAATGQLDSAVAAARRASEIDSTNAIYRAWWAQVSARNGDTTEALRRAEEARRLDSTCLSAHALTAEIYLKRAETGTAQQYISDGMAIDSTNVRLNYLEGERLILSGDTARALEIYRRSLNRLIDEH